MTPPDELLPSILPQTTTLVVDLPEAVLAHVLSLLDVRDVAAASLASRAFREAADNPVLEPIWTNHILNRRWGTEWLAFRSGIGRRALWALTDAGRPEADSLREKRWFASARKRHFDGRQRATEDGLREALEDDFVTHFWLYFYQANEARVNAVVILSGSVTALAAMGTLLMGVLSPVPLWTVTVLPLIVGAGMLAVMLSSEGVPPLWSLIALGLPPLQALLFALRGDRLLPSTVPWLVCALPSVGTLFWSAWRIWTAAPSLHYRRQGCLVQPPAPATHVVAATVAALVIATALLHDLGCGLLVWLPALVPTAFLVTSCVLLPCATCACRACPRWDVRGELCGAFVASLCILSPPSFVAACLFAWSSGQVVGLIAAVLLLAVMAVCGLRAGCHQCRASRQPDFRSTFFRTLAKRSVPAQPRRDVVAMPMATERVWPF